jgi:hypothetical protein
MPKMTKNQFHFCGFFPIFEFWEVYGIEIVINVISPGTHSLQYE